MSNEKNKISMDTFLTQPLKRTDKYSKHDYIYEIDPNSKHPFENAYHIISVDGDIYSLLNILTEECTKLDISKDDLRLLQGLKIPFNVKKKLGFDD